MREARRPIGVVDAASAAAEVTCAPGLTAACEYARLLPRKGEAVEFTPRAV